MPPKAVVSYKPRSGVQRKRQYQRIDGLSTPGSDLPVFRASTPGGRSTPTRSHTPVAHRRKCNNRYCTKSDVRPNPEDNSLVCQTCGVVVEQDHQLVSEQQFQEERGGRITAQGQTISHGQTHARALGQPTGAGPDKAEPSKNRQRARQEARQIMRNFCTELHIPESEIESGMTLWDLIYKFNFVQGRGLSNVATVCLYLALRRKKEQVLGVPRPKYPVMLIDFAEIGNVDVFSLGKMYVDLVRSLYLDRATGRFGEAALDALAHGPEVLVDRFVDSLEFPPLSVRKIKDDAIRIVSRMKRDWITYGRRPAGVCGAAVILAARMNNYRRSTREVVLTAKVNEITLNKRLEEFSGLQSSQLSVTDFRNTQILDTIAGADPPAYTRALNPGQKRKRGRPRKNQAVAKTAAEIETSDFNVEEHHQDVQQNAKRARVDAEGFAIPALPQKQTGEASAPAIGEPESSAAPRLGRPKGSRNWQAPPISPAEQIIEDELTRDISQTLEENADLATYLFPETDPKQEVPLPLNLRVKLSAVHTGASQNGNTNAVSTDPTVYPWEFEDDEEVEFCVLNEEERRLKETLWVNANRDWLRQEYAKKIRKELRDAELREKGIDPEEHDKQKKQKGGMKRKDGRSRGGMPGDVSYLQKQQQQYGGRQRQDPDESGVAQIGWQEPDREGSHTVQFTSSRRSRSPSQPTFPSMAISGAAASMIAFTGQRQAAFGTTRLNVNAVISTYSMPPEQDGSSTPTSSGSSSVERNKRNSVQDVIFGAIGGKDKGLMRSKSSISAEKREARKKADALRRTSEMSDVAGPSGIARSVSAVSSASASPAPGGLGSGEAQVQREASRPSSQQHTPTCQHLDDGSVEEVVGSHSVSRSHSDTPGPGDGLISLREDLIGLDENEDKDETECDDDEDENADGDSEGAAEEPDLDEVFAGTQAGRRG